MEQTTFSVFDNAQLYDFLYANDIKIVPHAVNIQKFVIESCSHTSPISANADELDWSQAPHLPKRAISLLSAQARLATEVAQCSTSSDGNTTKLLVRLRRSGALVETVIMHYERKGGDVMQEPGPIATILTADDDASDGSHTKTKPVLKPRTAVCISSQVGCKMACSFCATGTMGFKAHLTCAEICEQIFHANRVRKINSVIAMGMGEPFDNYNNLVAAIKVVTNSRLYALGEGNICVSTVGVVPRIRQFMLDCPGVKLALSLHAPNQALRNTIVPSARVYPLDTLISTVDVYLTRNKKIMIEYILIRNVNVSNDLAHELGRLLRNRAVILNLIPYNPTDVGQVFETPLPEEIDEFNQILINEYKILTTVRRTMGQDIAGACGQLVVKSTKASSTPDMEDINNHLTCSSTSSNRGESSGQLPQSSNPVKRVARVTRHQNSSSDNMEINDTGHLLPSKPIEMPLRSFSWLQCVDCVLPRVLAGLSIWLAVRLFWTLFGLGDYWE